MILMTAFANFYKQLNQEQRLAVDTIEGPVIVLAGPGTGKTQVLAMRVAKILQETHMDPHNIFCLTFTESATIAMRKRLVEIIGEAAYHVRIHTFHSFCNTVIQDHPEKFAFAKELAVLSDIERVQLFRTIIDALPPGSPLKPFGNPYLYLADISQALQTLKQEHVAPERYRVLVADLAAFMQATETPVSAFFALKPSDRTAPRCRALRRALKKIKPAPALQRTLDGFFADYLDELPSVATERAASSLRTKLKNDLKRWWLSLQKNIPLQHDLGTVYDHYQQRLQAQGTYDYEDMIAFVIDVWRRDDQLLAHYQEQLQYILIDEYQDTNSAQNAMVQLLGSWHASPNIFVVGDDQQSIYRFQGASLENLLQFYEWYRPTVRLITLQANYRSPQHILDAAYGVISRGLEALPADVASARRPLIAQQVRHTVPILVRALPTEAAEDYDVAYRIKQLLERGVPASEIAVLYRYHRDADGLTHLLGALQVPWRQEGGQDIFSQRPIQQLVHLLRTVRHVEQDDLLARLLHFDFLHLPALDGLKITHYASRQRVPLLTVLTDRAQLAAAGVAAALPWKKLVGKLAHWRTISETNSLHQCIAAILHESQLLRTILKSPDVLVILGHLTTLFQEIKSFNQQHAAATVDDFLAHLTVLQENGIKIESQPLLSSQSAVRLLTAHRAKGLEFAHVFVIRLTDGHWGNVVERQRVPLPPGVLQHERPATRYQNEDERRLFYVAMTRAKQHLTLTYARRRATGRETIPSLFLAEIPPQYCTVEHTDDTAQQAITRLQVALSPATRPPVAPSIKDWVRGVLDHYAMSVTHLNHYLACPRLFYYTHILRVPLAKNTYMAYGTAVHGALRDLFVRLKNKQAADEAYLLRQFTHHLDKEILNENERRDTLALGHKTLANYFQHYQASFITDSLPEYDFRAHGVQLDGLRLTGRLDKVEIIDPRKKLVNVVDYKTGNPDSKSQALGKSGDYYRQLVFYKLLCDLSPRFPYTMVSGEIDFVQPSARTGKYVKRKCVITDDERTALADTIRQSWQEIKQLEFLAPDNPKFCGTCDYCTQFQ